MRACDVSVLIPVHNRVDMTAKCLASFVQTRPTDLTVEVIVYDDCSSDGTATFLAAHHDWVRIVRHPRRGWFAANINRMAAVAKGRWLCLLNNDTILQEGWLDNLVALARKQPQAALIGNHHEYPQTGCTNHAGIAFDGAGLPHHLYEGGPATAAATYKVRRVQAVSGACCLVPADHFATLGGLDEGFRNGWEDVDFALRALRAGYEVWYCGRSRIGHYGHSSNGRMTHEAANRRRFLQRWRHGVVPDQARFRREDGDEYAGLPGRLRLVHTVLRSTWLAPARRCLYKTRLGIRLRERFLRIVTSANRRDSFVQR